MRSFCGLSCVGEKMNYDNTELNILQKDLLRQFGDEEGKKIFNRSAKLYAELSVTTDYKNSSTLERQLKGLVYPVIAYYKTLLAFGYKVPNALGLVRTETEKAAAESGGVLAAQMRPVFPYRAFKRNIKNFIEYKFPSGGWSCTDLHTRGKITFRIRQCLYYSITAKFGCPELCEVFCDYERKAFAGLAPKIVCERHGELATGCDSCDFCFRKG